METHPVRLTIVTPVYNDWEALGILLRDIEKAMPAHAYDIGVVAVDDCSAFDPTPFDLDGSIRHVDVIRLSMNLGHQRAIAVGLVHVDSADGDDMIAILDSDGEDRPDELKRLVDMMHANNRFAYVAQRKRRSEGTLFKVMYRLYLAVFRLLVGRRISFGNFSVISRRQNRQLVHNSNIWNNFAATLIQSKMPVVAVPTSRGLRYAGESKMNFVSLVTHGLGAISVFSDAVFVRILLLSLSILAMAMTAVIAVVIIRTFTDLAVPGWATTAVGAAILLSVQAIMTPIMLAFLQLGNRASFQMSPALFTPQLIERIERFYKRSGGSNDFRSSTSAEQIGDPTVWKAPA